MQSTSVWCFNLGVTLLTAWVYKVRSMVFELLWHLLDFVIFFSQGERVFLKKICRAPIEIKKVTRDTLKQVSYEKIRLYKTSYSGAAASKKLLAISVAQ